MAPERDYLGSEIVVTATIGGYASDDGSTATKTPTPLIDVPQTVTTITQDQIEDQSLRGLNEALRYVPGVSLDTGEGHRDAVYLRGQSTTADFYIDGLRDDAQYYRPLYNIERIEVLKGANALIFGRGGGGGAINRVSKSADTMQNFGSLSASVDQFSAFSLGGDVNAPLGQGFAARLNATYEEFDSNRQFYEGRFIGVSPTVTAELGPDTRLTATYSYDDERRLTDRGIPSLNGEPLRGYDDTLFGDPDFNHSETTAHIARARLVHEFSQGLSANATVQYANYDLFYSNIVPAGATATTATLSGYQSGTERENLIGQANLVAQFDTGGAGHTVLLGVEAMSQESSSLRNQATFAGGASRVDVPLAETIFVPAFTVAPQRASMSDLSVFAAYVQEQLDLGIVQLVGGVRYERFDLTSEDLVTNTPGARLDERWNPRLGVIVKPSTSISLYASYSESFLPQSGDQFSLVDPQEELLDPEVFRNYEVGLKWLLQPELFLTAAVFRLDRSNTQAADPLNPGFIVLTGSTRVEGFEASLAGSVLPGLDVSLGYTYLDGEIRDDTTRAAAGTRLQQLPKHQASAWAHYDLTERFSLGAGLVHQSSQFASLSHTVTLPAYTRIDAAAYYNLTDNVALQLNIENLFDAGYFASAHGDNNIQPGKPFTARIGAKVSF
ncbi:TonB-dependent siderophore receptor [Altererythrobacter salegens]|uniref:TonB-dependent siderophore receptor n=2 Tax=Croceibacterium salegens TaxID=1737568 RepID=A0A6I4T0S4_9SPHN|nr:TonB-dependent siderophore receptor [Croceibacterium salegens]